ncbi:hypothetical protein ARMSODRAFT_898260, partial [Armillaria solidipes]
MPCHRRLHSHSQGGIALPVHQFLYQDLQQWIGQMYACLDIERLLDRYPSQCSGDSGVMEDIWDGTILWEFSQNGVPFMEKPHREGKLVFGFNQDGLNPYGNKTGDKKVSVGLMYMVCFNLLPHLQ